MAGMLTRQVVLRRECHGNPAQKYFVYVPGTPEEGAPLLVAVHGSARGTRELVERFAPHCESAGAVLVAPCFPGQPFRDYPRLGRSGRGPRADAALHSILQELSWLMSCDTSTVHLFGFARGAQFAHRYAMAYPHRVVRAVAAAAGWYTLPDARARYPYGIRPSPELPGVRFEPHQFLQVPITAIVGDRDTLTAKLPGEARVKRQQGENRVERARLWVGSMRTAARACRLAPRVTLQLVPGVGHSFASLMEQGGLGARVFAALFESRESSPRSA